MKTEAKRSIAKDLYVNLGLSQKEIAARVEVSEQTIGKWKEKYKWDTLKAARISGPNEVAKMLQDQIVKIVNKCEEDGREPDQKEVDKISKLAASIDRIVKGPSLSNVIIVMEEFTIYLKDIDRKLAQDVVVHQSNFLQKKAKELTE